MSGAAHNWALAFTEYTKGIPLADISEALGIPIVTLKSRASKESWAQIKLAMKSTETVIGQTALEKDLSRIRANRERNLQLATAIQDHLIETMEQMREGKLTFEVQTKMGIATRRANLDDLSRIAASAEAVSRMTYRALGDVEEKPKVDQLPQGSGNTGQITIIMPGAIALPRDSREVQQLDEASTSKVLESHRGPILDAVVTKEILTKKD